MEVPDDLKADSGLKTHVRDAVRPHLTFITASLKEGVSEAAVHRYLIKHGHPVGSRSGFGAALKYLLREVQGASAATAPTECSSLAAASVPLHSAKPAAMADAGAAAGTAADTVAAEAIVPATRATINTTFAEHRVQPTFGGH